MERVTASSEAARRIHNNHNPGDFHGHLATTKALNQRLINRL